MDSNADRYDENDRLVAANVELFEREVPGDLISDCVETINGEYSADPLVDTLSRAKIVEGHGFVTGVVDDAFDRLEREDVGEKRLLSDSTVALEFTWACRQPRAKTVSFRPRLKPWAFPFCP